MGLSVEQLERLKAWFPTLVVEGECSVKDCWFGERVRLGAGVNVVESKVGSGSVIGAGSSLDNAEVGRDVRIGEGCRILTGAKIGDGEIIAAGITVRGHRGGVISLEGGEEAGLPLAEFLLEKLPLVHVWKRWVAEHGERLRVDYPLTRECVVIDVGGYRGDFVDEVVKKFGCVVEVFEPVKEFARGIEERFRGDARVRVYPFGLAGTTREEEISLELESSSVVKAPGADKRQTIRLEQGAAVLRTMERVDLLKVNIEGSEYELLEHLLDAGALAQVRFLQVQFHDFVADARKRRRTIVERLKMTHRRQWNYPFMWESWERIDATI